MSEHRVDLLEQLLAERYRPAERRRRRTLPATPAERRRALCRALDHPARTTP